jgi:hypothetical protein
MVDKGPEAKAEDELPGFGEKRLAIHELMVSGQASSLIVTNSADEETIQERTTGTTEKKKTKEALHNLLTDEIIKQRLREAQDLRDLLRTQLDMLNEKIREDEERLEKIMEFKQALVRIRQQLHETGELQLDEYGELKDKQAEAAIREYEKRYGIKIDRESLSDALLFQILRDLEEQDYQLKNGIEEKQERSKKLKDEIDQVEQVIEDLKSSDPQAQSDALERLSEIEKQTAIRKSAPEDSKENIEKAGYTRDQAEESSFEFSFPPIKDAFNKSAAPQETRAEDKNEVKPLSPPTPVPGRRVF